MTERSQVVERYVTTDAPLLEIAQNVRTPDAVTRALTRILECLEGRCQPKEALDFARETAINGADPDLLVLMLCTWAELCTRLSRPSTAETLLQRAKALLSKTTPPEIQAYSLASESTLANATGSKLKQEAILKDILSHLPDHSPRRAQHLWSLTSFLALQGRARDCPVEIRELTWNRGDGANISRMLLVQFVNAVETGDAKAASQLLPQLRTVSHTPSDIRVLPVQDYQRLLELMHASQRDSATPPRPPRQAAPWLHVLADLLAGDTKAALNSARKEPSRLAALFGSGLGSYNLIRAELASGNPDAARHLIQLRRGRGNEHYFDNLFLARAEWLAENRSAASKCLADLLRFVELHQAKGRLGFELALARELSQGDILELTRRAERIARGSVQRVLGSERADGAVGPTTLPTAAPATDHRPPTASIIGSSPAIRRIRETIRRFAQLEAPVLITGETGTGKELVARALHSAGTRGHEPFTAINCGAITENLLESELFGHERGAFTGAERANRGLFESTGKGTVFLDEIGTMPPRLQGALLRVLESGEIRAVGSSKIRHIECRIVAATNADLDPLADFGAFRKDLLFRLQRLCVTIPPLRERPQDIMPLVRHFLDEDRRIGVHARISESLKKALQKHAWPGNVRELRNVVERMRLLHSDKLSYELRDLDIKLQPASSGTPSERPDSSPSAPAPTPAGVSASAAALTDREVQTLLRSGRSRIRRLDRLRELFSQHGKLTRKEVIGILRVAPNTATKDLSMLCEEDYIVRVEPSPSTRSHYFELREEKD